MADTKSMKARLEARLAELDTRLHKIDDRLDDPVTKDWEDSAVEREEDEVLEDLGRAGLVEIEAIRAALARIEEGSYGICPQCGDDISDERLDVVPHAALCRNCMKAS